MKKLIVFLFLISSTAIATDLYDAKTALKLHQHQKAYKLFYQHARRNNIDAQYHLAVLYNTGKGVKKSQNKAYYWFKRAARKGNVRAQYNCGILLENGQELLQQQIKRM